MLGIYVLALISSTLELDTLIDYRNYKSLPNLTKLRIILNVDVSDTKSYHAILNYIRRTYEKRCDRPP